MARLIAADLCRRSVPGPFHNKDWRQASTTTFAAGRAGNPWRRPCAAAIRRLPHAALGGAWPVGPEAFHAQRLAAFARFVMPWLSFATNPGRLFFANPAGCAVRRAIGIFFCYQSAPRGRAPRWYWDWRPIRLWWFLARCDSLFW